MGDLITVTVRIVLQSSAFGQLVGVCPVMGTYKVCLIFIDSNSRIFMDSAIETVRNIV